MSLRSALFWILVAAILIAAVLHLGEIGQTLRLFGSLRWEWVGLAVAAQIAVYVATAWALQGLLAAFGHAFRWQHLWRATVTFVLGWLTVPAGGVGGLVFWGAMLARMGVPASAAIASGVVFALIHYAALVVLLAAGVPILFVEHSLPRTLVLTLSVASLAFLGTIGVAAVLLRSEARGLRFLARSVARLNAAAGRVGLSPLDGEHLSSEARVLYAAARTMRRRPGHILRPMLDTLAARVLDVFTLQILFIAVGHPTAWSVTTLGFVYASVLSLLPSGPGIIEASLALVYTGMGVPFDVVVAVIALYRALSCWLPIPYGLFLYHRVLASPPQPDQ